ncbi:MAG: Mth938-like domain-containing protein [Alphaproteobacteria bacterium]|jgi:uncharacterized protein
MSEDAPRGRKVVSGYGDGGFRIAGERVDGSVILFPERFLRWDVSRLPDLKPEDFNDIIASANEVDILLLGCGDVPPIINQDLRDVLKAHNIVIDAMGTGAACRTFNILLSESRAVAAALIAV